MALLKIARRRKASRSRAQMAARRAKDNGCVKILAHAQYPPALLKKVQEIQEELAHEADREVRTFLSFGRKVREILADFDTYQVKRYSELEPLFAIGHDTIGASYRLCQKFEDAEIDRLLKLKNPTTNLGLHRAHFAILARVKDRKQMFELAAQTVAQNWTKKQLAALVLRVQGRSAKGRGGNHRKLGSLVEIIRQQIEVANSFITKDLRVWQHKERGTSAQYAKILASPDGPDHETMIRLDELVELFQCVSTRIAIIISDHLFFRERYKRPASANGRPAAVPQPAPARSRSRR